MSTPLTPAWEADADLVVVGGGVAGLAAAIEATRLGMRVLVVGKDIEGTSTQYAQGGVAIATGDDVEAHVRDTLTAGAGLCDEAAVRSIVGAGSDAFDTLVALGATFDHGRDGQVSRTREGGHSVSRIVHAGGDATGREIQRALSSTAPATVGGATALQVVVGPEGAAGVVVSLGGTTPGVDVGIVRAPAVLIATGGNGMLYAASTNPSGATADGVALALRAGASIADVEFVQFHPTVLFSPGGRGRLPLVSEAVRGEGARLTDLDGRSIMQGVHPMGDLAPRDVVSRTIARQLAASGADHVLLDARPVRDMHRRFPTVTAACLDMGVDPSESPIPVAPAAHYACGGVVTDTDGRTSVPGLFAAGEVARTGLHGANRLASNSLLEGVVLGTRVARAARARLGTPVVGEPTELGDLRRLDRDVLQATMTRDVGVVRDADGLRRASAVLDSAQTRPVTSVRDVEDAAMTMLASATVRAAALRTETRGAHTRLDHVDSDPAQRRSRAFRLSEDGDIVLVRHDDDPSFARATTSFGTTTTVGVS
ncbi:MULTISPECIES: L-aspartate oxidase [unclassified Rhodococcus (in: high G+C Gram-positive bacteria)]|uniref:L-aspartate oxidase n=1 Tax=unclassified Rhodococcus (in: high G+C Gram-positive bacteria) TaxID=192944 RepID=UPI0009EB2174|nr:MULTISPECIES: L-aspartate oxidase [unclassified Rhodococcus (in: high G+C Gram-positive bacteria)]